MNRDLAGWSTLVVAAISVLLLVVGYSMWHNPLTAADAAVGKGLVTLGGCAAIITGALLAFAVSTAPRTERPDARDDWDDV